MTNKKSHPIFKKDTKNFYKNLQKEVFDKLDIDGLTRFGDDTIAYKIILLLIAFSSLLYCVINTEQQIILNISYILLGPLSVIILINSAHDASHGVAHRNKFFNEIYLLLMNLLGPNAEIWKNRHNSGHHNYSNVLDCDPDLKQSPIARIFPDAPYYFYHRWQHIYVPLIYAVYTLNMVFIRDINDLHIKGHRPKSLINFFAYKLIYLLIFIGLPALMGHFGIMDVLLAFLFMHMAAGYFITLALVPSHVCDHVAFPIPDYEGKFNHTWAEHQIMTTVDFATESKLMTWLLGGFNHHLAHHLFPTISHIHYHKITPIIKEKIITAGLEYQCEKSIWNAYKSHYRLLKNNSKPPDEVLSKNYSFSK